MAKHLRLLIILAVLLVSMPSCAQRFFNLTSAQVSVDSVMPTFAYTMPLPADYADSVYTATILYPEYIDMTATDVANYHKLSTDSLPELPVISRAVVTDRKRPMLRISFCPLVYRNGKYQILVSFMLRIDASRAAKLKNKEERNASLKNKEERIKNTESNTASSAKSRSKLLTPNSSLLTSKNSSLLTSKRYASHSVLRTGTWAKIRVPASGVYELTQGLIRQAGFSDLSRVHIYGYGGNLQDEVLDGDKLAETDDLHEVATCTVNGHRLFYAKGPVSWSSNDAARRTRNPYSDYGYYFLTENDSVIATVDSTTFINSFYPSADDYHSLHEVDGYSWYPGGRNLFDPTAVSAGSSQTIVLTHPEGTTTGKFSVSVTAGTAMTAQVSINGKTVGNLTVAINDEYDHGNESRATYTQAVSASLTDTVKITVLSGGPMRLDYVSAAWDKPKAAPNLRGSFSAPQYVYNIANQDHHADPQADMVIIIPTSQKLLTQAQRLAAFHEQHDSLRVNIVPADELYNEFSSGTPDANAYRRYMKMLYDRAQTEKDLPKYLLLFGGCVWDNRLLTSDCQGLDPDDLLLAYESENSFNAIYCYVDDGFFTYLDDGEGTNLGTGDKGQKLDMSDVAVGRFPVLTEADAKVMVDKTISYVKNANAGDWENTLMFMGDDGNNNIHMRDTEEAVETVQSLHPAYRIKKVMWDAYTEVASSTGNTYPEVTDLIKKQQTQGALIMDYCGHGSATQLAHEKILMLDDYKAFTNKNLPLWIFAACDIMAFDGVEDNIGVATVTDDDGGAVAVYGTTRTVYENYNRLINNAYLRYVLSSDNGKPMTLGEAQRLAKNELIKLGSFNGDVTVNKLQYALLGDPAISLNQPTGTVVIDSINGSPVAVGKTISAYAGKVARVAGHVEGSNSFRGVASLQVLDSKQLVTCRENTSAEVTDTAFTYYDRLKTVFSGSDSIVNGKFAVSFVVPFDLNYDGGSGLINAFAVSDDRTLRAHGYSENLLLGDANSEKTDTVGPKIFCYLNSPEFTNGANVNTAPYFVAQLTDESGINATGNGVGHNLELIIDGDANKTYDLNDNFAYDFGSYTSGSTYYNIPELEPGSHSLLFRAWDTMNNCSTAKLTFNVVKSLSPTIYSVDVSKNPASTSTTFIISHSLAGCNVNVTIDVFDMSGRQLWTSSESGTQAGSYTVNWDLTQSNGQRLQTGVYLYRVRMSADGSSVASKAKKLVVINNN